MSETDKTTPARPKVSRASRGAGFDLAHPTAPTVEAAPAPQAAASYVATTDNSDTRGAGPQTAPDSAGLALPLAALVAPVDPETDVVEVNLRIPRYYAAALDLACTTRYDGTGIKKEHARRALGAYLPDPLLNEAHRAIYGRNRT